MFDIQITTEQIQYVEELLKRVNFGQRGDADGDYKQQRTGILGQVAICDLFGFERPIGDGFDGGVDMSIHDLSIDIKTMGRTGPFKEGIGYVHNFMASQAHYPTQVYLFCSLNTKKNVLTVCGWLPKEDFFERSVFLKKGEIRVNHAGHKIPVPGKKGMYEIVDFLINQFEDKNDFINKLKELKDSYERAA